MTKVIRSWNSSEEVNTMLLDRAPHGKGFSAWMNKELLESNLMRQNMSDDQIKTIPKSEVRDMVVEL